MYWGWLRPQLNDNLLAYASKYLRGLRYDQGIIWLLD
jgi:hypothetical protein